LLISYWPAKGCTTRRCCHMPRVRCKGQATHTY
jgi:hypothetical protein